MTTTPSESLVIMGVAGCGKSSLAAAVSAACGLALLEGDDFHSAANRLKMAQGEALTDADRSGWLASLGTQLQQHPDGAVLSCSALKLVYRERLRHAQPGLRFVFLRIDEATARARVAARGPGHYFTAGLVSSQFAALESPLAEPGVLPLDATSPLTLLTSQVVAWRAGL